MRVLILEDEALLALDISQMVEDLGDTVVGPCHKAEAALAACDGERPGFALLDFNLNGHTSEAVADRLMAQDVPFAFVTGHGRNFLPERFSAVPLLEKPISPTKLEQLITCARDRDRLSSAS